MIHSSGMCCRCNYIVNELSKIIIIKIIQVCQKNYWALEIMFEHDVISI